MFLSVLSEIDFKQPSSGCRGEDFPQNARGQCSPRSIMWEYKVNRQSMTWSNPCVFQASLSLEYIGYISHCWSGAAEKQLLLTIGDLLFWPHFLR